MSGPGLHFWPTRYIVVYTCRSENSQQPWSDDGEYKQGSPALSSFTSSGNANQAASRQRASPMAVRPLLLTSVRLGSHLNEQRWCDVTKLFNISRFHRTSTDITVFVTIVKFDYFSPHVCNWIDRSYTLLSVEYSFIMTVWKHCNRLTVLHTGKLCDV